jgi:phospholipase C
VDNSLADQSSVLRFIEDNWQTECIGDHSFDGQAGSILKMFDFQRQANKALFLDPESGEMERK